MTSTFTGPHLGGDPPGDSPHPEPVRALSAAWHVLGASPAVPDMRSRRLLRLIADEASARADTIGHPIVQSFEHGKSWRWCDVDETFV